MATIWLKTIKLNLHPRFEIVEKPKPPKKKINNAERENNSSKTTINSQDFTPDQPIFGHLLACALPVEDPLHFGLHCRFPAEDTLHSAVSILIRLPPLQELCFLKCERRLTRPENDRCKLDPTSMWANVYPTRVYERRNSHVIVMMLLDIQMTRHSSVSCICLSLNYLSSNTIN